MDPNILVTYATRSGSTEEVAQAVTEVLRTLNLSVDLQSAVHAYSIEQYAAVVICVALYGGHMHKDVRRFLSAHHAALAKLPVALFVLGPVQNHEKDWTGARQQLDKELRKFPWLTPVAQHIVGGRFDPTRLGFPFNLLPGLRKMPASDVLDWDLIRDAAAQLPEKFQIGIPFHQQRAAS